MLLCNSNKWKKICYYNTNQIINPIGSIYFYDLFKPIIINKVNKINLNGWNSFNMITKDLLLLTGKERLSIINVNQHTLVRIINIPDSSSIRVSCILNKNTILTGDYNKKIKQWKIEGDNLKLISIKENAHENGITTLIKIGNGHILSGSRWWWDYN